MRSRQDEELRLTHPEGGHLQVSLSTDGEVLADVVLYVHGFGSVRNGLKSAALRRACEKEGWTYVAADFRGHGESSGELFDLRGTNLQSDLDVVLDLLRSRGLERLYLVGSSMGAWASAWFALRHPDVVGACTFLAPSLDFAESRWEALNPEQRTQWQTTGRLCFQNEWLDVELGYGLVEERDQFPLDRLIAEWSKPLWIVHGMRDNVVSYKKSISFVERVRYPEVTLKLIKNGDHRLEKHRAQLAEDALKFFTCLL